MADLNITNEELEKLKVLGEYLIFSQYKDVASFPRFEECFGLLFEEYSSESLQKIYKDICGKNHKYISFRRIIKAYLNYKEQNNDYCNETKEFFKKLFTEVIKNEGDSIGKTRENVLKFTSRNNEKMKAISKFCVITDENKEKIKGFRIYYDDYFKTDLFINKSSENIYISLEINLSVLDELRINETPDENSRDGITEIIGTYSDKITFLGFKCRSGKTLFIGQPSGKSFIIGQFHKQIHTIDLEIVDGELSYLKPYFKYVKRKNRNINKKLFEINSNYIKDEHLIYEEEKLNEIKDKDMLKYIFTPLINDEHFFNPNLNDIISGKSYRDIRPLTQRFEQSPNNNIPLNEKEEEFNEKDILKKAMSFHLMKIKKKNIT